MSTKIAWQQVETTLGEVLMEHGDLDLDPTADAIMDLFSDLNINDKRNRVEVAIVNGSYRTGPEDLTFENVLGHLTELLDSEGLSA